MAAVNWDQQTHAGYQGHDIQADKCFTVVSVEVPEVRLNFVLVFGCIHSSQPSHIYTVCPLSEVCGHTSHILSGLQAGTAQLARSVIGHGVASVHPYSAKPSGKELSK